MSFYPAEIVEEYQVLRPFLTPQERVEIDVLLTGFSVPIWTPFLGPQTQALENAADELFYGGAAGGGKTDLILGAALTRHWRSIVFRREYAELKGIRERAEELYGEVGKFNGQLELWRILRGDHQGARIEFGACQFEGDERKFQGRPHDLKGFDEITQFTEHQFRFLITWNRSTHPGQRVRVVAAGNPPVNTEGQWVINYWAPWLDPRYPNPAKQGELRWFITVPQFVRRLEWVDTGEPIPLTQTMLGKDLEVSRNASIHAYYDDPEDDETLDPKSRTFIKARVEDNPRLMETGYRRTLQNLPEPLRSMMLRGDFGVGQEDAEWQLIPTEWILQAQARWAASFQEFLAKQEKRLQNIDTDVPKSGQAPIADKPSEQTKAPELSPTSGLRPGTYSGLSPYGRQTRGRQEPPLPSVFARGASRNAHLIVEQESRRRQSISASPKTPLELKERQAKAERDGSVGVDVSRGGKDDSIISERLENWFGELKAIPGSQIRTGQDIIQILIDLGFSDRRIQIDVHGVGTSPFDIGTMMGMDVVPMAGAMRSNAKDRSGKLGFTNLRAEWHWKLREALEPGLGNDLALPPDSILLADLASIRWKPTPRGIAVEDKKQIKSRIGRSPDRGDALILAHAKPHVSAEAFLKYLREQVNTEGDQDESEQKELDTKADRNALARRGRTPGSRFFGRER